MIKFLIILAFVAVLTACVLNRRGGYIGDFIQLFAVQTTLLNSTGNDLSPEMKTFYDKALLYAAQAQLVHHQFGQKRPIPKNGGKTIEFRKFTPLAKALTPLTEGVTPAGNQLDVTAITATVNQYGDFIALSDVLELTAIDNVVLETTKLLGDQAGLTMDTIVRDILVAGTNVMYAPKINASTGAQTAVTSRANLDATAVLTVDLVQQVVARLRAVNTPRINGSYVAIIHPFAEYDIMRDPEWIDPHKYKDTTNLYEGEIGMISGVRFVESTEAKVYKQSVNNAVNANTSSSTTFVLKNDPTPAEVAYLSTGGNKIKIGSTEYTLASTGSYTPATKTVTLSAAASLTANDIVYSTDCGAVDSTTKAGIDVHHTMVFGADAYGVIDIDGSGAMQTIIKPAGSSGTDDPLDQRSTVAAKIPAYVAKVLNPLWIIDVQHAVSN